MHFTDKFSLNSVMGSCLFLNPMCPEADQLRALISAATQNTFDATSKHLFTTILYETRFFLDNDDGK